MNNFSAKDIEKLHNFRKELHKHPELSGNEKLTSARIEKFISEYEPDRIVRNIAGHGIAFIYGKEDDSPAVMFRAELDALPIEESNTFYYRSVNKGVGHQCGHDGHMTILCGIAMYLHKNPLKKGRVILLFQPEEETGQGAAKVIQDQQFLTLKPDYVFAVHNLPGYEKNTIILGNNTFASASIGIITDLKGRSSHAAYPEQGNSPARLTAELILELENLPKQKEIFENFTLSTIIHAKIGDIAFGTNPGKAELMATFRSYRNDDMLKLKKLSECIIKEKAQQYNIGSSIKYTEEFPATVNEKTAMDHLHKAAEKSGKPVIWIEKPFRWSEDFGNFTNIYKGALWGLGAGKNHPSLHNFNYDFPDDIIETGIEVFSGILKSFYNTNPNQDTGSTDKT